MKEDSKEYLNKKAFFDKVLTIYGRNAVLEALEDKSLVIHKLHLSDSNKGASVLEKMVSLAKKRHVDIAYHDKKGLSRISKNAKQDQGVALDMVLKNYIDAEVFLNEDKPYRVMALDGIQNPQNLGMIIRSCVAGEIDALILPGKNAAKISPLVIKASVGTLFKMTIIKTENMLDVLRAFKHDGAEVLSLSLQAKQSLKTYPLKEKTVFILGNESEGVSHEVEQLSDKQLIIPMNNGVESLNVAVTASLIAFR